MCLCVVLFNQSFVCIFRKRNKIVRYIVPLYRLKLFRCVSNLCSFYDRLRKATTVVILGKQRLLEHLGVDFRIILKWISSQCDRNVDLFW